MKRNFLIALAISLCANLILILFIFNSKGVNTDTQQLHPYYPYLSPRIFVSNQNDILINFIKLRSQLRTYVEQSPHKLGVYFEYLPSGVSIGVNEKDEFVSASLLKVPLIMGVYKQISEGKIQPDTQIEVTEYDIDKRFGTFWKKGVGYKATVQELIEVVIENSDNTAANTLFRTLNGAQIDDVFDALDIPKEASDNRAVITPKNYSSILRSLYLSSYLPKNYSNQLLEVMTKTHYKEKLPAGVPSGIKVAHKIGVYGRSVDEAQVIYSDCGIVYVPKRPYILCVMTVSTDEQANKTIQEISRITYDYVSTVNVEK